MRLPQDPSVIGSAVPVEPDPDDWPASGLAERSEEARVNEADDDSAEVVERGAAFGVAAAAEADEADVIEQRQAVDGDDEEDAPRSDPASSVYE
ncbi:MAG: hypothetical protein ACOYBY_00435 [Dermatophilaceae bacterium]